MDENPAYGEKQQLQQENEYEVICDPSSQEPVYDN